MKFKQIVANSFEDWKRNGFCQDAVDLNAKIGEDYFDTSTPHFFTGNVHAELVVVHLNPKRDETDWGAKCDYSDFDTYWDSYERFGYYKYGKESKPKSRGGFDAKQLVFLKPFGILPITGDKYSDLETSIDRKLQLELVPFGSPNFKYREIGIDNLKPFIASMIDLLASRKRKYIIFCGVVFKHILKDYVIEEKRHSFKLKKLDGTETKTAWEAINIKLKHNNSVITACVATHYAKRVNLDTQYGERVWGVYGGF